MTAPRWLPAAAVTVFAAALAWLNRGERVALDVGIATFYRAPLTVVLFLAFLAGMLSMLALSLRQDRRLRDELRARGILDLPARPAVSAASAPPEWPRQQEPATPVHPDPAPEWPRHPEPPASLHPDPAPEWPRHPEPPPSIRPESAADERTRIYPRYDEDPAA